MSTGAIVGIVIAGVVILALVAFLVRLELRRRHLRDRFGPEYDRIREDRNGRRAAEQELTERERRHAELGIRPVSSMARDHYTKSWALIQASFVDQPARAVDEADRLVVTIMEERGYPRTDFDERLSMLSVEHGPMLRYYRDGHDLRARNATSQLSTEDLRAALVNYRTFIEDLLESRPSPVKSRVSESKPRAIKASEPSGNGASEPPVEIPATDSEERPALPERRDPDVDDLRELDVRPAAEADTSMRPEAEARRA